MSEPKDVIELVEALRAALDGCHEKQAKVWAAMEAAEARVAELEREVQMWKETLARVKGE